MDKPTHSQASVPSRRRFCQNVLAASSAVLGAGAIALFSSSHASASGGLQRLYRLYNPQSLDHLYSFSSTEGTSGGYIFESTVFLFVYAQSAGQQPGTVQLYRLFSSSGGHFYTVDVNEVNAATHEGYNLEADYGWVYDPNLPQPAGASPFYRLYNSAHDRHFYTTDPTERDQALEQGFVSEGIACYLFN